MKDTNAVIQRSVDAVDEEKRSYSDSTVSRSRGLYILKESQSREKLRKWLSPPDPSTNHNIARKAHHKGTASWFFQGGIFGDWKSSSSLLWIHGKRTYLFLSSIPCPTNSAIIAGSGKSILWYAIFSWFSCNSSDYRPAPE